LISKGRSRFMKTKESNIPVLPGDVFYIESSGGGGYGDPKERAPEAHAADLADGFVTEKKRRGRGRSG
jgi:N-methylhydantoinase B